MNNNTEVVFDNIEQCILKEIKDAHYAIFVSVAWFTNKKLFEALLEKAGAVYKVRDPEEDEEVPVLLNNSNFFFLSKKPWSLETVLSP